MRKRAGSLVVNNRAEITQIECPKLSRALFTEYFFTSPTFRSSLPVTFSAVPRSCKLGFPIAFPASSLTLPVTSFVVPFILSVVLDFILLIRGACFVRFGLFRLLCETKLAQSLQNRLLRPAAGPETDPTKNGEATDITIAVTPPNVAGNCFARITLRPLRATF
jgi:hypothetical protein